MPKHYQHRPNSGNSTPDAKNVPNGSAVGGSPNYNTHRRPKNKVSSPRVHHEASSRVHQGHSPRVYQGQSPRVHQGHSPRAHEPNPRAHEPNPRAHEPNPRAHELNPRNYAPAPSPTPTSEYYRPPYTPPQPKK